MRKAITTVVLLVIVIGGGSLLVASSLPKRERPDNPWRHLPPPVAHVDHKGFFPGRFETGPEVTRACLHCHPNAAKEVMKTSHWTWAGQKVKRPDGRTIRVGKRNLINNFCIHVGPNIEECSSCHAGYGWYSYKHYDFSKEENVDCLVCHDQTGSYQKHLGGDPAEGVDLLTCAESVGRPTRFNCGTCHFRGGGGNAVKHGDMDESLYHPTARLDVHMGKLNFECVDCHQTKEHRIPGCAMSVCIQRPRRVHCTNCHNERPHGRDRLDAHTKTVACETCHIPRMAIDWPTKMYWDWSTAGDPNRKEDPLHYSRKKGSFVMAQNVRPEYDWYNGRAYRYLTGDPIDPTREVEINHPLGGPRDPKARIWPFKVHRGKQPYDKKYRYLLTLHTWGPTGFWTLFDWDRALRDGSEVTGLKFSGEYGFVATRMYWPLSHTVQPKEKALQCIDCHGRHGVLNWQALGYGGDPGYRGDRRRTELVLGGKGESR